MNVVLDLVVSDSKESRKPASVLARRIFRTLLIATAVALICLAIFLALGHARLSQSGIELIVSFVYSIFISLPSMLILYWIGDRYTARHSRLVYLFHALGLLFAASFGVLAGSLLLCATNILRHGAYWPAVREAFPFSVVITLVVGLTVASYETLRYKLQAAQLELHNKQMEQERAYKLLAEAQLSSLESRIHPHFLFNTLNSIAALIPKDPRLAEDTVGKLAALLRFSLNTNQKSLVALSQELKIVRDYLEIEKTRFGTRLSYAIQIPEELLNVKVPPLALQSLVENAVKHAVAQQNRGAAIQLSGSKNAGRIRLEVIDDGPGFSLDVIQPDHGLGNLIARLELLFGADGQLEVAREYGKTVVRLSFPA
jgi:two-component system, LytTR family, sensor histidine kinase AlgZ